jgi:hypothetical protein
MLAVLLPEAAWWEADDAMAAVPEVMEDIMLEVMLMLMESVSLEVMELSVEDAMEDEGDDAMEDELGMGAALLSLSMTKGGV